MRSKWLLAPVISFWLFAQPRNQSFVYYSGPAGCGPYDGFPSLPLCTVVPGEWPQNTFAVPSLGQSYTDYNFGGTVKILTDPANTATHGYSSPAALSATGKYAILQQGASAYRGVIVVANPSTSPNPALGYQYRTPLTWRQSQFSWDPNNDDIFYFIPQEYTNTTYPPNGWYRGFEIRKLNVITGQETSIINYGKGAAGRFPSGIVSPQAEVTKDHWWAFVAPVEQQVCAVNLQTAATYCAAYLNKTQDSFFGFNATQFDGIATVRITGTDSVTRKRYVLLTDRGGSTGRAPAAIYSVDVAGNRLVEELRGPEYTTEIDGVGAGNRDGRCDRGEECIRDFHSDVVESSDGRQFWVIRPDVLGKVYLSAIHLGSPPNLMLVGAAQGGARYDLFLLAQNGRTIWPDHHIGCAQTTFVCVFSVESPPQGNVLHTGNDPFNNEIIAVNEFGANVRRITMHRSVLFNTDYRWQPKAGISANGRVASWDTNFGLNTRTVVASAETGLAGPTYSAYFGGSTAAIVTIPAAAPFNSLTSYRLEIRLHGIGPGPNATVNQYVWSAPGVSIYLPPTGISVNLMVKDSAVTYYCQAPLSGLTDVLVRLQRNTGSGQYQLQVYDSANMRLLATQGNCGSATASQVSLAGVWSVAGSQWNQGNWKGGLAFLRFSTGASTLPPAMLSSGAERLRYEFEDSANLGAESSGYSPALPLSFIGASPPVSMLTP